MHHELKLCGSQNLLLTYWSVTTFQMLKAKFEGLVPPKKFNYKTQIMCCLMNEFSVGKKVLVAIFFFKTLFYKLVSNHSYDIYFESNKTKTREHEINN